MFTYIYIYIILYFIIYIYFLVYFLSIYSVINIEKMYLNYLLTILKKYFTRNPILALLFLLTGLPPVGFFFLKFNFLVNVYYTANFITQLVIFFNVLLTMFFYLQVYNSLNINNKISNKTIILLKKNTILNSKKYKYNCSTYVYYLGCLYFFFFNFFFLFFFSDIYLIFFNYSL